MVPPAGAAWSRTFSETPANGVGSPPPPPPLPPEPSSNRPARQHTARTKKCRTMRTGTRRKRLRYVMAVTPSTPPGAVSSLRRSKRSHGDTEPLDLRRRDRPARSVPRLDFPQKRFARYDQGTDRRRERQAGSARLPL